MAVFSTTELDATIDEKWDMEVDDARYAEGQMLPLVLNRSVVVAKSGDKVNMTYKSKLTSVNVTAGTGAFTSQNYTPTTVQLTMDQWKAVPIETVGNAEAFSFWKPESDFPKDAAKTLNEDYDNSLFDLDASLDAGNVVNDVDSPTTFTDIEANAALLKLENLNIPQTSMFWALPPVAFRKGICTKPQFVDASLTGLPKSVLLTGYKMKILGVPAYYSTLINQAGAGNNTRTGLLLHKSAFCIAVRKRNEVERASAVSAGRLAKILVMHSIWGVKVFRSDAGVRIHISNT